MLFKKHPCCKTKTGWHCICKRFRQSDLTPYGEGVVLYFMFLKFLALLFLLMSILSIPAYLFYWTGNAANIAEYKNVKYALAAFSLGNIGACKEVIVNCV